MVSKSPLGFLFTKHQNAITKSNSILNPNPNTEPLADRTQRRPIVCSRKKCRMSIITQSRAYCRQLLLLRRRRNHCIQFPRLRYEALPDVLVYRSYQPVSLKAVYIVQSHKKSGPHNCNKTKIKVK